MYRRNWTCPAHFWMNVEKDILKMLLIWKDLLFFASHFAIPPFFNFISVHQMFPATWTDPKSHCSVSAAHCGPACTDRPTTMNAFFRRNRERTLSCNYRCTFLFLIPARQRRQSASGAERLVCVRVQTVALCWTCVSNQTWCLYLLLPFFWWR